MILHLFLAFAFTSLIGNVVGLILWGMQSVDLYKLSDTYTFVLIITVVSLIKIIWIWSHSFIPCCKKLFLYVVVFSSWILSWLWIINLILVSSVSSDCIHIYNNYYKYGNGGSFSCNGEIVTLTFTILSTIIWTIIAIYISNVIYKKDSNEQEQEMNQQVQMQDVHINSDMEEVPL